MKKYLAAALAEFLIFSPVGFCPKAEATVSSNKYKVVYSGDGLTSTYSFAFPVYKQTDLVVSVVTVATNVTTTLALTTNYTVTLNTLGYGGTYNGSITLLGSYAPLSAAYQLVIQRVLPYTQLISLQDNSVTPASTYMEGYDRATMLLQQNQEQISRSLLVPINSTGTSLTPAPGLAIGWSSSGVLTNLALTTAGAISVPIADSNLSTISTAGKVDGAAITGLASLPSGAGRIPRINTPLVNTDTVATALVDGAGSVINAALGNIFTMTATADRTLGTTTGATNGQKIIIKFTASGAGRTLTLPVATTGDFAYGSDITALTQTASGKTDYIGCVYDSTASRWHVVAVSKGY